MGQTRNFFSKMLSVQEEIAKGLGRLARSNVALTAEIEHLRGEWGVAAEALAGLNARMQLIENFVREIASDQLTDVRRIERELAEVRASLPKEGTTYVAVPEAP